MFEYMFTLKRKVRSVFYMDTGFASHRKVIKNQCSTLINYF
jgi:hypothetical protein